MNNQIFYNFQEYLRSNSLVQEKYIPYHANWARNFMVFSKNHSNISNHLQTLKLLDFLRVQDNVGDWQVNQMLSLFIKKLRVDS